MAQWVKTLTAAAWVPEWPGSLGRLRFNPLAGAVSERIQHCCGCVSCSCGLDSIPSPGISIYLGCGHQKKKKVKMLNFVFCVFYHNWGGDDKRAALLVVGGYEEMEVIV